jgi:hypothetical protein
VVGAAAVVGFAAGAAVGWAGAGAEVGAAGELGAGAEQAATPIAAALPVAIIKNWRRLTPDGPDIMHSPCSPRSGVALHCRASPRPRVFNPSPAATT